MGTALGTVPIIAKLKADLHALAVACDHVVIIARWYQRVLLANGINENKISYIPQGLPMATTVAALKNNPAHSPLRLLFLGRINKFKGLHLLLEALSSIDPACVELSVYGNSDDEVYEKSLRALTTQRLNIHWRGKLQQADVVITMRKHDVLCLCSTFSEMSPLVIQEAFAARIPVLASNVYGNSEQILHDHNGILFQFDNIDDLRNQIIRLINDPYLLNNLIKNILPPKSFESVGEEYYELYKTILN